MTRLDEFSGKDTQSAMRSHLFMVDRLADWHRGLLRIACRFVQNPVPGCVLRAENQWPELVAPGGCRAGFHGVWRIIRVRRASCRRFKFMTSCTGNSTPNCSLALTIKCIASRECPPTDRKLSSMPISVLPRNYCQSAVIAFAVSVCGVIMLVDRVNSYCGTDSDLRSILPFGVFGRATSRTKWRGTM